VRLTLQRLSDSAEGTMQLQLSVETGKRALSQEFYTYAEDLREFGAKLEGFPTSLKHAVVFECGANDPKVYCWVRLRAYVYDHVGHSALEVLVQNNCEPPLQASAVFSVKLEAATLNRLGQELIAWTRLKHGDFHFESGEA
jgi:hypothetical protein